MTLRPEILRVCGLVARRGFGLPGPAPGGDPEERNPVPERRADYDVFKAALIALLYFSPSKTLIAPF